MSRALLVLLFISSCYAQALGATFGVEPSSLVIEARHPIAEVEVSSLFARRILFDSKVTPDDGWIVVPAIFTLDPYQTVVLRVTPRHPVFSGSDRNYELVLTEVVPGATTPPPNARIIRVPIVLHASSSSPHP